MRVLDIFSGLGGFSLGLERAGMRTLAFCEIDKHCQKVLKKHWPSTPIFDDVKEIKGQLLKGSIDLICGGFPCQDISVGGKQKGIHGSRSGLWKEYARLIKEINPRWAIIENVENLRKSGLVTVLNDLAAIGYNAQWYTLSAIGTCGLPHKRKRLFIISYPSSKRFDECIGEGRHLQVDGEWDDKKILLENSGEKGIENEGCLSESWQTCPILSRRAVVDFRNSQPDHRTIVSSVRRVIDGIPSKSHEARRKQRIKQLGNSVVPQIVEFIGKRIMEIEKCGLRS